MLEQLDKIMPLELWGIAGGIVLCQLGILLYWLISEWNGSTWEKK